MGLLVSDICKYIRYSGPHKQIPECEFAPTMTADGKSKETARLAAQKIMSCGTADRNAWPECLPSWLVLVLSREAAQ